MCIAPVINCDKTFFVPCLKTLAVVLLVGLGYGGMAGSVTAEVRGRIQPYPHERIFAQHFQDFQIIAQIGEARVETTPDEHGQFRFPTLNPTLDLELTWNWTKLCLDPKDNTVYLIWPVKHVKRETAPYNDFRFKSFEDVKFQTISDIKEAIGRGNFKKAQDFFDAIEVIFNRFPDQNDLSVTYHGKKYDVLKQITTEAAQYRREQGSSAVTDDMLLTERMWLRKMMNAVMDSPSEQSLTNMIVALTAWSAFSIEYAKNRVWPERTIASIAEGQPSFFRKESYQTWMIEDIELVQQIFNELFSEQIEVYLTGRDVTILKNSEQSAVAAYKDLLAKDPEAMSLITLANFITGLNRLRLQK